ncbi:hypothetical protein [Bosea vaviloviae]|uniref:hypothetical protein n=1 Tax=Bosea vaviloviae TaxID=1526658 RepID=UPI000ADDA371|nr:hypothetical protein [Bosea vaviloviae]
MTEPLTLVSANPGKAAKPDKSSVGDFETAAALFRPIFARIAEGAVAREHERRLPSRRSAG